MTLDFRPFVFLLTVDRGLVTVDLLAQLIIDNEEQIGFALFHWHIIKLAHSHCLSRDR